MLIKELYDYYDKLKAKGKIKPAEYTYEKIHFMIELNPDGTLNDIIDIRDENEKFKEFLFPIKMNENGTITTSGTNSRLPEIRGKYIFGLTYNKSKDEYEVTDNSEKSFETFVQTNLTFFDDLSSDVIDAYKNFIKKWNPENEKNNTKLDKIKKEYDTSNFAFCLAGKPNDKLQDDPAFKDKWSKEYQKIVYKDTVEGVCAITGEKTRIARLHDTSIKTMLTNSDSRGDNLISINFESGESYGKTQAFVSPISKEVSIKYSEALNYLLKHNSNTFDDHTRIIYWSEDDDQEENDIFNAFCFDSITSEDMKNTMEQLIKDAKAGNVSNIRLANINDINKTYYIAGIKPFSKRIHIPFFYKKSFGEVLANIVKFQTDMSVNPDKNKPIRLYQILLELKKFENEKPKDIKARMSPEVMNKLFHAMINNANIPDSLYYQILYRIKVDQDKKENKFKKINDIRLGIIKIYLNRKYKGEKVEMALNTENTNEGYLMGRLFAVYDKIQRSIDNKSTLKENYFGKAMETPGMVFPAITKNINYYMNKLENPGYKIFYDKIINEIISKIDKYPKTLSIDNQGMFVIGYNHQMNDFYTKKETIDDTEETETETEE